MNIRSLSLVLLAGACCLAGIGCHAPGKPTLQAEGTRPDEILDFRTLYKQNCAACHGEEGKNGAAISLANPIYLATAGTDNILRITASGVSGTAMPVFGKSGGGMLTDRQIAAITKGMIDSWGKPEAALKPIPYASSGIGDLVKGKASYSTFCARCHGADGSGQTANKAMQTGSIVDPAYLALISNQGLRSIIIAGRPDLGMPDWRSDAVGADARAMTDQEITDTVAWLTSHRIATPGQPYLQHR